MQLALHIEAEEEDKQYDFSQIALLELYNSYQFELDRSYTHLPATAKKRAKVRHWRFATQSYLETINNYLYLLDSGARFNFFVSKQNKIFLLIEGIPVIISGPNSGADKKIENNIVEQFCSQYDCHEYFEKTHRSSGMSVSSDDPENFFNQESTGQWAFNSKQVSLTMSNGLIFNFSNLKNRQYKERWAIEVSNELFLLLAHLKRMQDKGKIISWSSLLIEELPLTDNAYKIIVNKNNDYIKLTIPFLGDKPLLFKLLIPWLKKSFKYQSDYRMIIDNADKYLTQE